MKIREFLNIKYSIKSIIHVYIVDRELFCGRNFRGLDFHVKYFDNGQSKVLHVQM